MNIRNRIVTKTKKKKFIAGTINLWEGGECGVVFNTHRVETIETWNLNYDGIGRSGRELKTKMETRAPVHASKNLA